MPCNPSLNNLNPPVFPPIPGPGGIAISPFQIPFPNIKIPNDLLEDLMDLVNEIGALFPSGTFKPNIDEFTKTILDAISNVLSQIAPFLSLYNFIMALFKLILCIIEVLCALLNPFALVSAMIKLFTECLPPFINLFPFLALIAMIIALLLLIIALIEYIIAAIIALIEELINNLILLGQGVTLQDAEATLAAIQKISDLLCLIQNLMAVFVALGAIMAIIEALALVGGAPICDGNDPTGCCYPAVCPPFIKDGPITGKIGQMKYFNQVGVDLGALFANVSGFPAGFDPTTLGAILNIPPTRTERWQFVDTNTNPSHNFVEIITPVIDITQIPPISNAFWPEGVVFDGYNTPSSRMPYNVDLRIMLDPHDYISNDTGGPRFMRIKGTGTVVRPYVGLLDYQQNPDIVSVLNPELNRGTLNLSGGTVFEDDGTTEYKVSYDPINLVYRKDDDNGLQATLNTLIHKKPLLGTTSPPDNGIVFNDIEFTFTPNYGVLMGYTLITLGCMPGLAIEKAVFNSVLIAEDVRAVIQKLNPRKPGVKVPSTGFLPNVAGAQNCVIDALNELRKNVSIENAAVFQAAATVCLNDLLNQTQDLVCEAIIAATSQFKSDIELDTDVQFTNRSITAQLQLRDPNGTDLSRNIPAQCVPLIESKITSDVTFGQITPFKYDGSDHFTALITSTKDGTGELTVSFDGKVLNTVVVGSGTTRSVINENVKPYTFIGITTQPAPRRDTTDTAESGGIVE